MYRLCVLAGTISLMLAAFGFNEKLFIAAFFLILLAIGEGLRDIYELLQKVLVDFPIQLLQAKYTIKEPPPKQLYRCCETKIATPQTDNLVHLQKVQEGVDTPTLCGKPSRITAKVIHPYLEKQFDDQTCPYCRIAFEKAMVDDPNV